MKETALKSEYRLSVGNKKNKLVNLQTCSGQNIKAVDRPMSMYSKNVGAHFFLWACCR